LHDPELPGSPDIVFRSKKAVIFVHGCFWHRCPHCSVGRYSVQANQFYWRPKFERNVSRDKRVRRALWRRGWAVMTIWECQVGNTKKLQRLLTKLRSRKARQARQFSMKRLPFQS
jgi:DNA mismatch endonuclease (patch repair protein)